MVGDKEKGPQWRGSNSIMNLFDVVIPKLRDRDPGAYRVKAMVPLRRSHH